MVSKNNFVTEELSLLTSSICKARCKLEERVEHEKGKIWFKIICLTILISNYMPEKIYMYGDTHGDLHLQLWVHICVFVHMHKHSWPIWKAGSMKFFDDVCIERNSVLTVAPWFYRSFVRFQLWKSQCSSLRTSLIFETGQVQRNKIDIYVHEDCRIRSFILS